MNMLACPISVLFACIAFVIFSPGAALKEISARNQRLKLYEGFDREENEKTVRSYNSCRTNFPYTTCAGSASQWCAMIVGGTYFCTAPSIVRKFEIPECKSDAQCPMRHICDYDRCILGCRSDENCDFEEACINGVCQNPCSTFGVCGRNANCRPINHKPECTCPTNFRGNPNVVCEQANVSASCTANQTECGFGCCPYRAAVCCADGTCCQHAHICIPVIGRCIGLNEEDGKLGVISTKTTSLENLITACPPGMTTCGKDKCCRYPHATCCPDGNHCCPEGYRCDVPNKRCIRDSFEDMGTKWDIKSALAEVPALKMAQKSPYKPCPGSGRVCPSYSSCCIKDNGEWGCCPNPSFPQLSYGDGECCDTWFGELCCPDILPVCTPIGCV